MTTYAVTSEVLVAGTIVHVIVESSALGEWAPEPVPALRRREGTVTVRLMEVLRGRIDDAVGAVVVVDVVQRRPAGRRPAGYLGPWSHAPTDPGASLVAWCDTATRSLTLVLTDEHVRQMTVAGPVLADLRLSLALQRRHLTADRLLQEAERQRGVGGEVFARYVWVAAREALRASLDRFDRLMAVAEDPATRVEAQSTYLVSAYEDLTFTGEFSAGHRARLVRAMFASALDPRLGELRATLLGVYVPNLLASAVPGTVTPDDVFGAAPEAASGAAAAPTPGRSLRVEVRAELDDPRDPATTSPALRAWLDGAGPTDGEA